MSSTRKRRRTSVASAASSSVDDAFSRHARLRRMRHDVDALRREAGAAYDPNESFSESDSSNSSSSLDSEEDFHKLVVDVGAEESSEESSSESSDSATELPESLTKPDSDEEEQLLTFKRQAQRAAKRSAKRALDFKWYGPKPAEEKVFDLEACRQIVEDVLHVVRSERTYEIPQNVTDPLAIFSLEIKRELNLHLENRSHFDELSHELKLVENDVSAVRDEIRETRFRARTTHAPEIERLKKALELRKNLKAVDERNKAFLLSLAD